MPGRLASASPVFLGRPPGVPAICACTRRPPASARCPRWQRVVVASLAAVTLWPAGAGLAQPVNETLWVTNGAVHAIVPHAGRIYIGGAFTRVGPVTGGGAPLSAASGAVAPSFPKVDGIVRAVAPDGAGGFYIGGSFTRVGGLERLNLAHIAADLSVTAWNPKADGTVHALLVRSDTVYAGGYFTFVGGQTRHYVAALDASGAATPWDPYPNSVVLALATSGNTIYLGGYFGMVGVQSRSRLAAVLTDGTVTPWNPSSSGEVYALAVIDTVVYAGGVFGSVGGQLRSRLAAMGAQTGAVMAWNPGADNLVRALAARDTTLYVGGDFGIVGGLGRNRVAAIGAESGIVSDWNPGVTGNVHALAVGGTIVYAGGYIFNVAGQARSRIAALDATSGALTAWDPSANEGVFALAASGGTIYAGGQFTAIGGQVRTNVAALDAASGAAAAWSPNANGEVRTLAVVDTVVYAGGSFTTIGGQSRNRIAALGATTGTATGWDPNANSTVEEIVVSGATVYVGGYFTTIGGQPRTRIAAVDAASGSPTAWSPNADSYVLALAVGDGTIYAGGMFASIGGESRLGLAALSASTGHATAWGPDSVNGEVTALAVNGGRVYVGGAFSSVGEVTRHYIAALDTSTGDVTGWDPGADGKVLALAVSENTVYAGGEFTNIGRRPRSYLAALDVGTGDAARWEPGPDDRVLALALQGSTLYAGGYFDQVRASPRGGIAAITAAPEVHEVRPGNGGDNDAIAVTLSGRGLANGATVTLTRAAEPDLHGTGVVVAPDGLSLTTMLDLRGAAHGAWDVVVALPDSQTATLAAGFTVQSSTAPQLRVEIVGPGLIRGNHRTAFDLVLQNQGNVGARAVPLWIAGVPADAAVEFDFQLSPPPGGGGEPDWTLCPFDFPSPGGRYLALLIPDVPPGTVSRRLYLTVPPGTPAFQLVAALTPPWGGGAAFRTCLYEGGVVVNSPCMVEVLAAIDSFLVVHPWVQAVNGIGAWAKIAWQCEGAATLGDALIESRQALDFMLQPVQQQGSLPASCADALAPRWREALAVSVVSAVDPNDKLGPHGLISQQQAIPYSIRFENLSTATAPALQVVIVDALDMATLNPNTVSLDAIAFGAIRLVPPPGLSSYATEVDLRPATDLKVRVSATVDRYTGVLVWTLTSIDPATGQPPTDPLAGFLPPNVQPPEGEGSVLFTVRPVSGLGGDFEVHNDAVINFDGSAQATPAWTNLVDNTPPASVVMPLSSPSDSSRFTVRWAAGSPDLRDYTIYVSEDGGAYRAWRSNTAATADTFASTPGGHQYAFYSVARDVSGNVEAAPALPDAETYSPTAVGEAGAWRLSLEGARPNPAAGAMRVWFTLADRRSATLELIDVVGRRVVRREVGSLGPGVHDLTIRPSGRLRPGLYFLRLTHAGRTLIARVAFVQ